MRVSVLVITACMITVCFSFVSDPASAAVQGWQEPIMVQTNTDYTQCDTMGIDDQGNVMIIWEHPSGNTSQDDAIYARTYNRVLGWSEPEKIFDSEFWWGYTTMSMAPNGRAIAAWGAKTDTDNLALHARFFDPISGWGQTWIVVDHLTSIGEVAVDVNSEGDAVYVWGGLGTLFTSVYEQGTGWSSPEMLGTGSSPIVALDAFGNAIAIWNDRDPYAVKASRYVPGEGWGGVVVVSASVGGFRVSMDMDADGRALAAWFMYDGITRDMYAAEYTPAAGWEAPAWIGPADGGWYPNLVSVTAGSAGEFFVIWQQSYADGSSDYSIWSRRWTDTNGWDDPSKISSDDYGYMSTWPSIRANRAGQAVATWTQHDDATLSDTMLSRYTPGLGWSDPEVIDNSDTLNAWMGRSVIDPLGNIASTWKLDFGQCILWGCAWKAYWAPDVMISEPLDGTTTIEPSILVRGFAEPDATLIVSDMTVPVLADGSFEARVYLESGDNIIFAIATDRDGNSTETSITVRFAGDPGDPVAVIEISPCVNWKTWRFDGRESTDDVKVMRYLWDFGDDMFSESKVSFHKYQKAGNYVVTLTVWDDEGRSDSISQTISVEPGGT
jgi:hypothetical protein